MAVEFLVNQRLESIPQTKDSNLLENITQNASSSLRIVLNKECNLKCIWCYNEGVDHANSKPQLSSETFSRVISLSKKVGFNNVCFSGGEPFMYPHLFKLVEDADSRCLKTYVTTNATFMHNVNLKDWSKLNYHEFHVSLNTTSKKEFQELCGRDMLDKVLMSIQAMVEHKIPLKLNSVVTSKEDWPRIKGILDFARKFNLTVKLLGVHDTNTTNSMTQSMVGEMVVENGGKHIMSSGVGDVNYGYEKYEVDGADVHVLNMFYGGGCCSRFKKKLCGEGIRYPRLIYTGDIKPCLHNSIGTINNGSSDDHIKGMLIKSREFIKNLSRLPVFIDSYRWSNDG